MTASNPSKPVRIVCVQWQMRHTQSFAEIMARFEAFVRDASSYGCDAILFPEFFNLPLLSDGRLTSPQMAIHALAQLSTAIIDTCAKFAVTYGINIVAGSLPHLEDNKLYNVSTFCHRDGRPHNSQYKLHPTPYEKREWNMQGGNQLHTFDTDFGKVGILICYDVEFPELARLLADQQMDILLVPFWTDSINAYHRVRYCAQARAIENECYVAIAGSAGTVMNNDVIDTQHAQSAIFSPSDLPFPEHAVLAEARTNEETMIVAELDLDKLYTLRESGSVQINRDRRRDLYQVTWHANQEIEKN